MKVRAQFLRAAADVAQFPPAGAPEIAFLGRSNVGKSSLINSLVGEKMAKTSSTPGRTRTINFFEIRRPGQPRPDMLFVDLPGYGYAKLPRDVTAEWPKFIEPYLEHRPNLALCIVLVDINVAPQQKDRDLIAWLRHVGRAFLIVATKSDRLSGNKLTQALKTFGRELETENLLPFSARTGAGLEELWRKLHECTANPAAGSTP